MGTFSFYLSFDGDVVLELQGLPPMELLTLFAETDRVNRPSLEDDIAEDDEAFDLPLIGYSIPAWKLVQRLEIMGFTLAEAATDLEGCLRSQIRDLETHIEHEAELIAAGVMSNHTATLTKKRLGLAGLSLPSWVSTLLKKPRTSVT